MNPVHFGSRNGADLEIWQGGQLRATIPYGTLDSLIFRASELKVQGAIGGTNSPGLESLLRQAINLAGDEEMRSVLGLFLGLIGGNPASGGGGGGDPYIAADYIAEGYYE